MNPPSPAATPSRARPAPGLEKLLYRPGVHVAVFGQCDAELPILAELRRGAAWCRPLTMSAALPDDPGLLRQYGAVIIIEGPPGQVLLPTGETVALDTLLNLLREQRVGAAVISASPDPGHPDHGAVYLDPADAPAALRGACLTLGRIQPVVRELDQELASLEDLGRQLARQFEEINQELRLAARLQHDFLPRQLPEMPGLALDRLFRPCGWVSGDIFDAFRIDADRVGLYVADAVGHGVASGLLTMFITNAIQNIRSAAPEGQFIAPSQVLCRLNDALASQDLPDSQFVTCWYGVLDVRTRKLTYSSGGHPPAVILDRSGVVAEAGADGCLLGVFSQQTFVDREIQLLQGQRLLVFSDGLEMLLLDSPTDEESPRPLSAALAPFGDLPAPTLIQRIRDLLDTQPGGLSRGDDVTLLIADLQ